MCKMCTFSILVPYFCIQHHIWVKFVRDCYFQFITHWSQTVFCEFSDSFSITQQVRISLFYMYNSIKKRVKSICYPSTVLKSGRDTDSKHLGILLMVSLEAHSLVKITLNCVLILLLCYWLYN